MIFALVFVSVLFLACLGAAIFAPKQVQQRQLGNKMSFFEKMYIVTWPVGDQEVARIRALRVYIRRYVGIISWLVRAECIMFTLIAALFLAVIVAALLDRNPTAGLIGAFLILNGQYIFFPIIGVIGLSGVFWHGLLIKLWIVKDNAPIRVHNLTCETLNVFIQGLLVGETEPGVVLNNSKVLSVYEQYSVVAKDLAGNTFYHADLNLDDLDNIDWNVDIK